MFFGKYVAVSLFNQQLLTVNCHLTWVPNGQLSLEGTAFRHIFKEFSQLECVCAIDPLSRKIQEKSNGNQVYISTSIDKPQTFLSKLQSNKYFYRIGIVYTDNFEIPVISTESVQTLQYPVEKH